MRCNTRWPCADCIVVAASSKQKTVATQTDAMSGARSTSNAVTLSVNARPTQRLLLFCSRRPSGQRQRCACACVRITFISAHGRPALMDMSRCSCCQLRSYRGLFAQRSQPTAAAARQCCCCCCVISSRRSRRSSQGARVKPCAPAWQRRRLALIQSSGSRTHTRPRKCVSFPL